MARRLRALVLVALLVQAPFAFASDTVLAKANYPEGPLWHHQTLYYGEMVRDRVTMSTDLKTTSTFWEMPGCGPVSIAPYRQQEFLVLCHLGHKVVRVSIAGKTLGVLDRDSGGRPIPHPNGSIADDKGGVYFTSSGEFHPSAPATGAVLHLDGEGKMRRLADGIRYANGIAVDLKNRRVFVSEHLTRRVLAFPLLDDGTLGRRIVFFDFVAIQHTPRFPRDALAGPDGLELDDAGRLIIAEYGAGRIHLVSSAGAWLGTQDGFRRYVTDMTMLPGGRAAITQTEANDMPLLPGDVVILDRFLSRFQR
jgi:sugar lactone lactonase YvrE